MSRIVKLGVAILVATTIAGCASTVNPVSGKKDRGVMSEQDEIKLGQQYHQEVLKEYPQYENAQLQAYVNGIGQKLAAQSQRPNLPWTFTVVDSPEINAFAVPGGYVYMTRGLMAYLGSEAELAGVLGHEIGHITARHGARADRDQKIAAGLQLLGVIGGALLGGEQGAQLGAQVAGAGAAGGFLLPRSREHELQADRLGAEYLQRVNYDPDVLINVIQTLKAQETFSQDLARAAGRQPSETPNWLRTHPANDDRLREMRKVADQYSGKYQDSGRQRYLQMINGMTYGESSKQGLTRGQNFYHEPLGFTLRAATGWSFQNAPDELTVLADSMQAAVAMRLAPNTRGDHNAAIRSLLAPDQGRTEQATINGLRATHFFGSKQNRPIDATVITLGSNDYVFLRMQKPEARGAYDAVMRDIINSFRALTQTDAANARPYTLRTVALPRSAAPFADMAREVSRTQPQIKNVEGQLRLLNQVYPTGNVNPGQPVKTIQ
jgi:predicted Zn-dependent protease